MSLSLRVLVLNKNYIPIEVTHAKRALSMLYQEVAKALDEEYRTYDFMNWLQLEATQAHERIGLVERFIRVPQAVVLKFYDQIPQKQIRFSRINVYLRDQHICQYCGQNFSKDQLNLDHVIPKSKGGLTTWENVVCCCLNCNKRKADLSLAQAEMKLIKKPSKPRWSFLQEIQPKELHHWKSFLGFK